MTDAASTGPHRTSSHNSRYARTQLRRLMGRRNHAPKRYPQYQLRRSYFYLGISFGSIELYSKHYVNLTVCGGICQGFSRRCPSSAPSLLCTTGTRAPSWFLLRGPFLPLLLHEHPQASLLMTKSRDYITPRCALLRRDNATELSYTHADGQLRAVRLKTGTGGPF